MIFRSSLEFVGMSSCSHWRVVQASVSCYTQELDADGFLPFSCSLSARRMAEIHALCINLLIQHIVFIPSYTKPSAPASNIHGGGPFLRPWVYIDRRESQCHSALLTVGLGLLYDFSSAVRWSKNFPVVCSALFLLCSTMGWLLPSTRYQGCQLSKSGTLMLCLFSSGLCSSHKQGSSLHWLDGRPLSRNYCIRITVWHWWIW